MNKRIQGWKYEEYAKHFLIKQGLVLLQQNYYCSVGELDLIMLDNQTLVFVEVRYRYNDQYGTAQESLTVVKKRRLYLTAQHWMEYFDYSLATIDGRFDLVAITGVKVNWLKNILMTEEYEN